MTENKEKEVVDMQGEVNDTVVISTEDIATVADILGGLTENVRKLEHVGEQNKQVIKDKKAEIVTLKATIKDELKVLKDQEKSSRAELKKALSVAKKFKKLLK